MTRREEKRLLELIKNPPRGSKVEAAKRHGVDLTLNVRRLALSPTQRAREMEGALLLLEELQRAARSTRS
jgi:hypothetical protein